MTEYAAWDSPEQAEADREFLKRHGYDLTTGEASNKLCSVESCCGTEARMLRLVENHMNMYFMYADEALGRETVREIMVNWKKLIREAFLEEHIRKELEETDD